ncbi:hypothetical protein GCM10009117_24430 [Gangjinia marincola]|uniref:Gliding motility lipoprotein GldB n=1 Tax=Gangjinia marincola TaxID=578463 RepID=A0ABN1MJK4_9FLAO
MWLSLQVVSCNENDALEKEIQQVDVRLEMVRFDQLFADATPQTLGSLKAEFPYLFPKQIPDSVWVATMRDTLQIQLQEALDKTFPANEELGDELHDTYQHLKYYFPEFTAPKVITMTTDVDYREKIIYTDSLVLVGLDTYMGDGHEMYQGIPLYIQQNMKPSQITQDIVEQFARRAISQPKTRNFLDQMVYYGKILYLKEKILPQSTDAEKIGYTQEQLEWATENEGQIWKYFIENEVLYDTDPRLKERFINMAPFSKFNLALDPESPPRLGQYIGWQIVKEYAEKSNARLKPLLITDAETIFNQSKFKPGQ